MAETDVPRALVGKTLAEAAIPRDTQCNVIALRSNGELKLNPTPDMRLTADAELLLICTTEGEQRFMKRYGNGVSRNGAATADRA